MFNWFKKKSEPSPYERLRSSILGNMPLAELAAFCDETHNESSPWHHFAAAHKAATRDRGEAERHLRTILELPSADSRIILHVWNSLCSIGVRPDPQQSRNVLGMVVEVGLSAGLDSVAAYHDHTARYFNHSGGAVVWDTETEEMNAHIAPFLEIADVVRDNTEPLDEKHPPPPEEGMMLINVLTPGGIHIGLGPMDAMQGDPMGAAVTQAAFALMQALMKESENAR